MLTIAVLGQKGGVGKSTIAQLIARTYAANGWQVQIGDLNLKQKTSIEWASDRMAAGIEPAIAAAPYANLKQAQRGAANYDLLVLDGFPDADPVTIEVAQAANLIVIPTRTTKLDLYPQVRFAGQLRDRAVDPEKILFVFNQVTTSAWIAQSREQIATAGFRVAETELKTQNGYSGAQNQAKAISETGFRTLDERAEALMQEIIDRFNALAGIAA